MAPPCSSRRAELLLFAKKPIRAGPSMRSRPAIPIDSKRALAALTASNTLGVLALYVIPLIVGATADGFRTSEGTAGIVSSWELGVMAAVSTLLAAQ